MCGYIIVQYKMNLKNNYNEILYYSRKTYLRVENMFIDSINYFNTKSS